jgi:plastocyanin
VRISRAKVAALSAGLVLVLGGCGSGGDGGSGASGTRWLSSELSFKAGEKVTLQVKNNDDIEHNFTFAAAKADTDVEGGQTATVEFTAPAAGSYEFFCEYHPASMKGTVKVT